MNYKEGIKGIISNIPQVGRVDWIGIRPKRRAELEEVQTVQVSIESGLEGDHYSKKGGKRQVTLIQAEHLKVVADLLRQEEISPKDLRRNIVVSGINLIGLKALQFQIGTVILETTGNCHPCTRMEENLGAGGYHAMRGHGGITAKVIQDGVIKVGDTVQLLKSETLEN